MANRNRQLGYQNRRNDFGDYNRGGFARDSYGGPPPPRGPPFPGVSPWQGAAPAPASTETTIALASNLISNLLQSRGGVPSLLDINVRRDFGGYGQGGGSFQPDRRGPNRMGGRNLGAPSRRPMQSRHVTSGTPRGNKFQEHSKPKAPAKPHKKEEKSNSQSAPAAAAGETKEGEGEETEADGTKKDPKTAYDGIHQVFLVCHICEKKMWDGRSFENHIKGRAHHSMMEKIRESYKMTADAMRQEQRISELRKDRRGFQQQRKVFCAMCDLYVAAESAHRRSPGHQKLKRYLHPACNTCRQEMPTRIEFEEHRLTPQHLRVLQDRHQDQDPDLKPEVMQMSTLNEELALVRPARNRQKKGKDSQPTEAVKAEGEEATAKAEGEGDGDGEQAAVKEEPGEGVDEQQQQPQPSVIVDYQEGDDLSGMTRENLPRYQPERALGASFITDFTCKQCTICRKLFDSEETAEVHSRTYKHFKSFMGVLHSKGNFKTKDTVKRELPKGEEEEGDEGNDGNWKRRKVDTSTEEYQNGDGAEDESNVNGEEMNVEDMLDSILDEECLAEDSSAQEMADDTLDTTPVESMQEEPQVVEPEPEPAPAPVAAPVVAVKAVQQNNRGGRGRGRGRGRGASKNRI